MKRYAEDTKVPIEERLKRAEAARRARVVELCELAKAIIHVSRQAPTPEHALESVLTVLVCLDEGANP